MVKYVILLYLISLVYPRYVSAKSHITDLLDNIYSDEIVDSPDLPHNSKPYRLKNLTLYQTAFESIPEILDENFTEVMNVYSTICDAMEDGKAIINIGTKHEWQKICNNIKDHDGKNDGYDFFYQNFVPFLVQDHNAVNGLFTGYFCPIISGSKVMTEEFRYPIYKRPDTLKKGRAYYTREEINNGALDNMGLELLWLSSKVNLYMLHIQGSGIISLPNGELEHIVFDGKNGHDYTSIGEYIIKNNIVPRSEIHNIYHWLESHPKQVDEILNINKSYVFFKEANGDDVHKKAIYGSHGSVLFPERSLAVDPKYMPYGMPIFLKTNNGKFSKIVFSQDTGSAISGPIRGDIYFGIGDEAHAKALEMNSNGMYYILIHKDLLQYLTH